jgi:hypothetical protein
MAKKEKKVIEEQKKQPVEEQKSVVAPHPSGHPARK